MYAMNIAYDIHKRKKVRANDLCVGCGLQSTAILAFLSKTNSNVRHIHNSFEQFLLLYS